MNIILKIYLYMVKKGKKKCEYEPIGCFFIIKS